MASSNPGFQVAFPKPSLENPVLFSRFADTIASHLRQRYASSAGYRVTVDKKEDEPKNRKWTVTLYRGFLSSAEIRIKPIVDTPHIANLEVCWGSRLLDFLMKAFFILSLPGFLIFFLAAALKTRLGFAVILTLIVGFLWLVAAAIVFLAVARLAAAIFGNEFDHNRRDQIARDLKLIPLPKPSS